MSLCLFDGNENWNGYTVFCKIDGNGNANG